MSRANRLLRLLDTLRRNRFPVTGAALAAELGVSLRTLYRDIATLQQQGADVRGEPGLGYRLQPGFLLPPLMFSEEEIEALVLGSRWVASRGDARLGAAARNALAKITAVLPPALHDARDTATLLVGPGAPLVPGDLHLPAIRSAIRAECKLDICYRDLQGAESTRTIWPFALGFFDEARVVIAWCELRRTFRHFRADRIAALTLSGVRYPSPRQSLLQQWREKEGITPQ